MPTSSRHDVANRFRRRADTDFVFASSPARAWLAGATLLSWAVMSPIAWAELARYCVDSTATSVLATCARVEAADPASQPGVGPAVETATVSGAGSWVVLGDQAGLLTPQGVAVDLDGNLYVA